jgi:hypothetical protein
MDLGFWTFMRWNRSEFLHIEAVFQFGRREFDLQVESKTF